MTGTLKARIERLEQREAPEATGGLYWLMPVPEGEPLPESYPMGGLHVVYARQAEIDAARAPRSAPSWRGY
jgi:hypothetical protein